MPEVGELGQGEAWSRPQAEGTAHWILDKHTHPVRTLLIPEENGEMKATPHNQKTIETFRAKNGLGVEPWGDNLLLMTSKGALSGEDITTPLVYTREGEGYVVVASKGGAPENPTWYRNIHADPVVEVEVAGAKGIQHHRARAHAIETGPDRDRLYAQMAEVWPAFNDYEKKTDRKIPIVILDPDPA